jgi:AMIN domain
MKIMLFRPKLLALLGLAVAVPLAAAAPAVANQAPGSTAAAAAARPTGYPTLVGVRWGRHAGYDRAVFDFTGGTPGWQAGYGPLYHQAKDERIPLAGRASLSITFTVARAHDDAGRPTYDLGRTLNPRLASLRQIRFGGDFEGYVGVGLGLSDRLDYHIFRLANPARVVVDIAHQPSRPFRSTPVRGAGTATDVVIEQIRAASHPGYDRVVFTVRGPARPRLHVAYTRTRTGVEVTVTALGSPTASPHATCSGPASLRPRLTTLRSVTRTAVSAGSITFRLTTTHPHGFRVIELASPTRIAVDLAH